MRIYHGVVLGLAVAMALAGCGGGTSGASAQAAPASFVAALASTHAALPACAATSESADCTASNAPTTAFHGVWVDNDGSAQLVGDAGIVITQNADGSFAAPRTVAAAAADSLLAIARVNPSTLVIAGSNGFLARSSDNGVTWNAIATHTTASINAIAVSADKVLAVGANGSVFLSTDAGLDFASVPLRSTEAGAVLTADLNSVAIAADGATVFLGAAKNTALATTVAKLSAANGTANVQQITLPLDPNNSNNPSPVTGLAAVDAQTFYAVTLDGHVFSSVSGNVTALTSITDPLFANPSGGVIDNGINGLVFTPGQQLVAVGGVGGVYLSSDLGNSWSRVDVAQGTDATQQPVLAHGGETNYPYALAATAQGVKVVGAGAFVEDITLNASDPPSAQLTRQNPWTTSWQMGIAAQGSQIWAVGQAGSILSSADNGKTWSHQFCPGIPGTATAAAVAATTGTIAAVAAGSASSAWLASPHQICGTVDGGINWRPLLLKPSADTFSSLGAYDAHTVFAGAVGAVLSSVDGGATWTRHSIASVGQIGAILPASASLIYGSDGASLIASTDGGNTWSATAYPAGDHAVAIAVLGSANEVVALMRTNTGSAAQPTYIYQISYTLDGGASWKDVPGTQVSVSAIELQSIAAASPTSVFVVGTYGAIFEINPTTGAVLTHQYFGSAGVNHDYPVVASDPLQSGKMWIGGVAGDIARAFSGN